MFGPVPVSTTSAGTHLRGPRGGAVLGYKCWRSAGCAVRRVVGNYLGTGRCGLAKSLRGEKTV